jgi:phosphatidylinositol/phosphatidylcholine transfer protein
MKTIKHTDTQAGRQASQMQVKSNAKSSQMQSQVKCKVKSNAKSSQMQSQVKCKVKSNAKSSQMQSQVKPSRHFSKPSLRHLLSFFLLLLCRLFTIMADSKWVLEQDNALSDDPSLSLDDANENHDDIKDIELPQLELSPQEVEFVTQFRSLLSERLSTTTDNNTIIRYIRARDNNIQHALLLYHKSIAWRKEYKVDSILSRHIVPPWHCFLQRLVCNAHHGFDTNGRPIYIEKTGQIHVSEFCRIIPEHIVIATHVWFMEHLERRCRVSSRRHGKSITQCVNIMDMSYIGLSHRMTIRFFKKVSFIDQNYYPELLGKLYFINCPWVFHTLWSMCKPFLAQATVDKIHILGSSQAELATMVQELGAENLPREYGGTCDCQGDHTPCMRPVLTKQEIDELKLERPKDLSHSAFGGGGGGGDGKIGDGDDDDDDDDGDVQSVTVKAGQKQCTEIDIKQIGEVHWTVTAVKHNIGFSVYWKAAESDADDKDNDNDNDNEISDETPVPGAVTVSPHTIIEEHVGFYTANTTGVLVLEFDNSFSRWRSKEIMFSVRVEADD